jgi:hypothetical protein
MQQQHALSEIGEARVRRVSKAADAHHPLWRKLVTRAARELVLEFEVTAAPFTEQELAWFRRPL